MKFGLLYVGLLLNVFICQKEKETPLFSQFVTHRKNAHFPEIIKADSLAFFGSESDALKEFKSLKEKGFDRDHNAYIDSRITSLEAGLGILPESFKTDQWENQNTHDIFDEMVKYDVLYYLKPKTIDIELLKSLLKSEKDFLPKTWALNRIGQYYKNVYFDLDSSWHYYASARDTLEQIPVITREHVQCYKTLFELSGYKRKKLDAILYANELCEFTRYSRKVDAVEMAGAYLNRAQALFWGEYPLQAKTDDSLAFGLLDTIVDVKQYQEYLRNEITFNYNLDYAFPGGNYDQLVDKTYRSIKRSGTDHINIDRIIANYQYYHHNYREAIRHAEIALQFIYSEKYFDASQFSNICTILARSHGEFGQFDVAISYIIKQLPVEPSTDFNHLYHTLDTSTTVYSYYFSLELAQLTYSLFQKSKNKIDLIHTADLLELVNIKFYKEMNTAAEDDILKFYNESGASFFKLGAEVYYQLFVITGHDAFLIKSLQYSEKGKYSLLFRDMNLARGKLQAFGYLFENQRQVSIQLIEEKIKGVRGNMRFNQVLKSLNKIEDSIAAINRLNSYSAYAENLKIELNIKQIQEGLDDSCSILNIIPMDSSVVFVLIKKDSILNVGKFLIHEIISPDTIEKNQLAVLSLKPWFVSRISDYLTKKVIIVPDGIFDEINFSALLNERYDITNSLCLKLVKLTSSKKVIQKVAIFSFSDEESILSNTRSALPELPGAYKEARVLQENYPDATSYMGLEATKENFIRVYKDTTYDYIHLAIHGISNSVLKYDVKLYFRTDWGGLDSLFGYELLKYKSSVKKIVLSACESASGNYKKGEGEYSLVRDFILNGAEQVEANNTKILDNADKMIRIKYEAGRILF